jgi:hypothetical protein
MQRKRFSVERFVAVLKRLFRNSGVANQLRHRHASLNRLPTKERSDATGNHACASKMLSWERSLHAY